MKQKYLFKFIIIVFLSLLFLQSCRIHKIPEGEALLTKNTFKVKGNTSDKAELGNYVRIKPNKKFLTVLPLQLYLFGFSNKKYDDVFEEYFSNPYSERNQKLLDSLYIEYGLKEEVGKPHGFQRWMYNNGEKPKLIDTVLIANNAKNLYAFYRKKGYWDVEVDYEIKNNNAIFFKDKKKTAIYKIKTNEPTKIESVTHVIPYSNILQLYEKYKDQSLVKAGDNLDGFQVQKEYGRIEKILRNNGYYNFNQYGDEIMFYADSSNAKKIPLTLKITKSQVNNKDSIDKTFKISHYNDIKIILDRNNSKYDTIYNYLINNPEKKYKNEVFGNAITFNKGDVYRYEDLVNTNRSFVSLNNFIIEEFKTSTASISDSLIDVYIYLKPKLKYDVDLSLDGFYGGNGSLGIISGVKNSWRNLFGGAENLEISLNAALGTLQNDDDSFENFKKFIFAYEIMTQGNLRFPRWLLPFGLGHKLSPKYLPNTEMLARASLQKNIGLDRINLVAQMNYNLNPKTEVTHKITIFNLQYTNVLNPHKYFYYRPNDKLIAIDYINGINAYDPTTINPNLNLNDNNQLGVAFENWVETRQDFLNYLVVNNPTLEKNATAVYLDKKRLTENILLNSLSYEFNFNQTFNKDIVNPFNIVVKAEFAGNVMSALSGLLDYKKQNIFDEKTRTLFGISYSQFAKFDFDIRKHFTLYQRNQIVTRLFFGIGIPYGNSIFLPFDRRYFMGGSNDLRAWYQPNPQTGTGVGPGDIEAGVSNRGYGNLKLLISAEWRIPFSTSIEGALFVDAGNVWETDDYHTTKFSIKDFHQQIAVGTGFGIRYNIGFFILRGDFAYRTLDPSLAIEDRFVLFKNNFLAPTFQFGLGYPF